MDRQLVLDTLIERSESLLKLLDSTNDMDLRLKAVEGFLSGREALLSEFQELFTSEDDGKREKLMVLDTQIKEALQGWMSETSSHLKALRDQREGLLRAKRTNAGYLKMQKPAEGYFIDRKK